LYFGGFSLETEKGSTIGRSAHAGGYQVILGGDIADDVLANSAALELNGAVGGDVIGQVSSDGQGAPPFMPNFPGSVPMVAPGLRTGETAEIGGEVKVETLETGVEVDFGASMANYFRQVVQERLGEFIALLIVGGLLLWYWPNMVQRASTEVQEKALPNAGRGCLITLIFPIALVIAIIILILVALLFGLITLGQLSGSIFSIGSAILTLLATVFAFIFSTVTKAVVAFLGGRLVLNRLATKQIKPGWWLDFASLALGAFIYEILRIIPFVGLIVSIIVILVGLGAIYMALRQMMRPSPPLPPPPPPPPPPVPSEGTPTPEATV
jgi:hypothetical protein